VLEAALATHGFRSISAADYGFQEKLDLYASAEIIVAPHGSGLANIAFCAPGTHIIEIEGDDWSDPWFGDVARAVGLSYSLVRAFRTVSPAWLPDIVRHLEVDVEKVMAAVDDIVR
jgi:capsular polysaccharide biosynthesis protein